MGGPLTALIMPFEGLAVWAQTLFYFVFALIVAVLAWTVVIFVSSRKSIRSAPEPDSAGADGFLWVFLVPALNEEVTIVDSVDRLLAVEATNKAILVINDGSTDRTAEVLAGLDSPELEVLNRVPPDARKGKAAALNAAWRHLDTVLSSGRWAGWPRERVVIVVIDADGRLDPRAPEHVAGHFADPRVGGLQVLVRIYNRNRPLTWCQDVEFSVYGLLFQAGRTSWGTAGMGGNGQFNRLSALDSIADEDAGGPWRNRLTEDQDLGLRLIEAGWRCGSESRTSVNQQGRAVASGPPPPAHPLGSGEPSGDGPSPRRLAGRPAAARPPRPRRLPAPAGHAGPRRRGLRREHLPGDLQRGQLLGRRRLVAARLLLPARVRRDHARLHRERRPPRAPRHRLQPADRPVYAAYAWIIWPVLARATARQLTRRSDWAKTAREPIREGG